MSLDFHKAYYIKLGRRGIWEHSSIKENKIRIGWANQTLEDINGRNWGKIKKQLEQENKNKSVATLDYNALKCIVESSEQDLWITFYLSKLWWSKPGEQIIYEDRTSKYRKVKGWSDSDINGNSLIINQLPGNISKIQAFRATVCKVKAQEELRRLLNAESSEEYNSVSNAKTALAKKVEGAIKLLHWKDFETLVDLLFRNSGWRRVSLLGGSMKFSDMELEEPITGDLYQVQVKSHASFSDFTTYTDNFSKDKFRKFYFVVHSPTKDLLEYQASPDENYELILPDRLAEMVVDLGLINWLMKKIR